MKPTAPDASQPPAPLAGSPIYAQAVLPLPRNLSRRDWLKRGLLWLMVIVGFGLMLRFDVALVQWRYRHIPDEVGGWSKQVLFGFRDFGQVLPITVAVIIIYRLDRRRWLIIGALLLAQVIASLGYNTGKYAVARYRPYAAKNAVGGNAEKLEPTDSWLGWKRSLRISDGRPALWADDTRSFPSGHSAAAFAFAGILAWFYPQLRRLWWVLAAGCAASRFFDAVHWPSDCWVGATIGALAAWIALRPYLFALPVIYTRRLTRRRR